MKLSEHDVQKRAVGLLRKAGVRFFAVPNGGLRSGATAARLWQEGVSSGVPDLVIIDPPNTGKVGTVVEVKTETGRVSPEQRQWLDAFSARGWEAKVVHGLDELLDALVALGYLPCTVKPPFGAAGGGSTAPSPTAAAPRRGAGARGRPNTRSPQRPTADTDAVV